MHVLIVDRSAVWIMRSRLAIAVVCAALLLASHDIAAAQTPPVTASPRPAATPTLACPSVARTRLIVRERARVTEADGLNVRQGANTSAEVVGQIDDEAIVYVLEGPVCSARYAWYRVVVGDLEGWIAEAGGDGYYVEVYPPG